MPIAAAIIVAVRVVDRPASFSSLMKDSMNVTDTA